MKWATSAALMRGDANGTLRPRYSATRAEIATIFKRFIEIKEDLEANKPDTPLGCDHVWETTETAMVDVVVHEDEENWIYMKDVNSMSICNGCDLDIYRRTFSIIFNIHDIYRPFKNTPSQKCDRVLLFHFHVRMLGGIMKLSLFPFLMSVLYGTIL